MQMLISGVNITVVLMCSFLLNIYVFIKCKVSERTFIPTSITRHVGEKY